MRIYLLLLGALASPALGVRGDGACVPVSADRILGRDLALADPGFAPLPATLTLAYAPPPGGQRVFAATELARIARANGIALADPHEVCFEVPVKPVALADAQRAMMRALPAGASLTVVELQKVDGPGGDLEFPIAGLEPTMQGTQLWRGSIRYAPTKKMPVWARVSIQRTFSAVVAGKDLPPSVPIDASALRIETRTGPMEIQSFATRVEDALGKMPKRAVKAGDLIPLAILEQPVRIHRGDPVRVEVQSGHTRLQFDAVAERDAREGDLVELRNPSSGRTFKARIDGSRAIVVVGGRPL